MVARKCGKSVGNQTHGLSTKSVDKGPYPRDFPRILPWEKPVCVVVFQRSGETISRYFKIVLDAVCRLDKDFYKIPVETDERWKWFKGCLEALDGTYIKARVPTDDRKPYQTPKGKICTNVLGVCTRDLMFPYVLAGWEGSAADSRVLRDAISRPNGLKIPRGTNYLCDVGYTNGEEMTQDPLDNEVAVDHTQDGNKHDDVISMVEISNEWSDQRDNLANAMFNEFNI
ncbi:ALP1-like protein [Tanacetum coccineum]